MYTDPNRVRGTEPGETNPEKNPLWAFHETFNPDKAWVEENRAAYAEGKVKDVPLKDKLVEVLNVLLEPIRKRHEHFGQRPDDVMDALREGTRKANVVAEETLQRAKAAMKQDFFRRDLSIG
jgi:tryptophanyl-tRNA synthetase